MGIVKSEEDLSSEISACWGVNVLNDTQDISITQNDISNSYTKKPSTDCIQDSDSLRNCNVCFESKSKEKHAENELEVTEKRDIETIGQVESNRMLNSV